MTISGKVIDRFTRQALGGVALSIEYQGKKLLEQTNQDNGSFTIELILSEAQQQKLAAPLNLVAKKEGYKPESVELNPQIEQQQLTIALEEETFEVRGKAVDSVTKLPLSEVQFMFRIGDYSFEVQRTDEKGVFKLKIPNRFKGAVLNLVAEKAGYYPKPATVWLQDIIDFTVELKKKRERKKEKETEHGKVGKYAFVVASITVIAAAVMILYRTFVVEVPDVIGLSHNEAAELIRSAHLAVGRIYPSQERATTGRVVQQQPPAGKKVLKATAVKLWFESSLVLVRVPEIRGLTKAAAERRLTAAGLHVGEISYEESERAEEIVLRQDPVADERVVIGSRVNYVLSRPIRGQEGEFTFVPTIIGLTPSAAENRLQAAGLRPGRVSYEEGEYEEETVLSQNPGTNERVEAGTQVDYVVSRPISIVPRITGLTLRDAKRRLREARLRSGMVQYEEGEYREERVLMQEPRPGERVKVGSVVNYVLSKPVERVQVPPIVELHPKEAVQALVNSGLRVGKIGVKIIPTGEELVNSQNPEAEEWVNVGSAVDFTAVIPADRAELSRETEREKIERYRSYLYTLERRLMQARR